jgi:hypothetical protein
VSPVILPTRLPCGWNWNCQESTLPLTVDVVRLCTSILPVKSSPVPPFAQGTKPL